MQGSIYAMPLCHRRNILGRGDFYTLCWWYYKILLLVWVVKCHTSLGLVCVCKYLHLIYFSVPFFNQLGICIIRLGAEWPIRLCCFSKGFSDPPWPSGQQEQGTTSLLQHVRWLRQLLRKYVSHPINLLHRLYRRLQHRHFVRVKLSIIHRC